MSEETTRPEDVPGTPQAAAAAPKYVDFNKARDGNKIRAKYGLRVPVSENFGGGYLWLRPLTSTPVSAAREATEKRLRLIPDVKRQFPKGQPINKGLAGVEMNRAVSVSCVTGWEPAANLIIGKKTWLPDAVAALDENGARKLIEEALLPPIDVSAGGALEDLQFPPDPEFLEELLESVQDVGKVPAQEIADVGKGYTLGLSGQSAAHE